jgi:hypothetical protein
MGNQVLDKPAVRHRIEYALGRLTILEAERREHGCPIDDLTGAFAAHRSVSTTTDELRIPDHFRVADDRLALASNLTAVMLRQAKAVPEHSKPPDLRRHRERQLRPPATSFAGAITAPEIRGSWLRRPGRDQERPRPNNEQRKCIMSDVEEKSDESFDLIVGGFLKCAKGRWCLDDVEIKTGPDGVQPTILMSTARHGRVRFDTGGDVVRPVVSDLKRYADCDPPQGKLPLGLCPYTIVQCLIDGELATFAASSWGARKAFKRLYDTHRYVRPREFPTVSLGTRRTGDANDNVAPTFHPEAWVPAASFFAILPGATEKPQLAPTAPIEALPPIAEDDHNLGRIIDDDIPF